jgi:LDH2 family malate/lactate/ureidoglycolate dehydrogenase
MTSPLLCPTISFRISWALFLAAGVPAGSAGLMAESVVAASLRGVDSHGVHLAPHYIRQLRAGHIDPHAEGRVVSESGACLVYDGEHGLGQHISAICADHAVRLARAHGIGIAIARDSNHFGAAAFWGQRISAHGFLGVVMCNASPSMPPWQGRQDRFGTNPICVSVPVGKRWMAARYITTTVAMNRRQGGCEQCAESSRRAMDHDRSPPTP